ncbi:MAG TPA: glycosyltransferase family 4 protein [Thermoanaerobaculia bacterium]|nr:glycosyltransferase family 4 protein [Thermoanaerobaculia bacterium]
MRRVTFVNRYFHPDHSATSQIASDLAFHLAARGWEVAAITSRQRYDDARAGLRSDTANGVRIVRVWSTRFGRAGLIGRAIDYLTFYLSAFFAMRRERGIVVAMTDPPLLSVVAALASRRVVNWVQDLFPEVASALGIRAPRVLRVLRDWSLRRARANVVLGDRMAARVPKATVIHNWAMVEDRQSCLSGQAGLPVLHPFTVGYSGNLGRAHDVDTILAAIRGLPHIRFVFTGGGAQLEAIRRAGAANVEILPYAPRERLSESLSAADVHLVSLQPALEGLIVPSKFYGVLAVARPVLFIGARDGELARLIDAHRCGVVVESGDGDALVRAIEWLAADRAEAKAMGARGRELYLARFAPAHAFAAWERVLEEAAR